MANRVRIICFCLSNFLFIAGACGSPALVAASSAHQDAADFLYELALEHQRSGQLSEAIRELREALLLNPGHEKARTALTQLETAAQSKRQQVMDDALTRMTGETAPAQSAAQASTLLIIDVPPSMIKPKPSARVPNAEVNGAQWLYVFGPQGNADYGALSQPQRVFIDVPKASAQPLTVQVLDADVRGRHDEMDGQRDTTTIFRLRAGEQVIESQTVGPETRDRTTLTFGPYGAERGEPKGDKSRFCLEAEGLKGNDNNLYALAVTPASAECFSEQVSLRLAEKQNDRMAFFPQVSAGSSQVLVEQNYDLDPNGGQAALIPVDRSGKRLNPIPLASSGSGKWATTQVPVPANADGARWEYSIRKATQNKGNMAFKVSDQSGQPLPVFFDSKARPQKTVIETPLGCNVFHFDASESSDPDNEVLTYLWDFGDGQTAEGVSVDHAYSEGGTYRVRLTVKDSTTTECCVSEVEQTLPVNLPPTAVIDGPATVCASSSAHFSAAQSQDTAGETLRYRWDFGDGQTAEGMEADHVFAGGGNYTVILTVDDDRHMPCSTAQKTAKVHVNSPPVLQVAEAVSVCAKQPTGPIDVLLSAVQSKDPDGDALTFSWDFGDGSRGSGEQATHTYQEGGQFIATVTANDGSGSVCSTATAAVPVSLNHPPVAVADMPSVGCPDRLVTFNATKSSDADGQALTYYWNFGDGHKAEGATVQHAYVASGPFRAQLTVRDNSGLSCNSDSAEMPVNINAPPTARMTIRGGGDLP